jgi:pimeloyl-ACP methyl ester carboxylesterase
LAVSSSQAPFRAITAETRFLDMGEVRYAYRRLGPATGVPLLFMQRFGGTMDDWDPALLDVLAAERPLLLFDNSGIGRSSGETASTFTGIARAAASFVEGLGEPAIDVLGWSMGGYAASHLALDRPDLVRRLILASSGPGYLENAPPIPNGPVRVPGAPVDQDAEYISLSFPQTAQGRAAGVAHLARLRLWPDRLDTPARPESAAAQLAARGIVMTPEGSLLPRFRAMTTPALVASGHQDIRIPAYYPFVASQAMPNAKLILYPDAGHGFPFQLSREFGRDALNFLGG